MDKLIIWDLCGGSQNSVLNAGNEMLCDEHIIKQYEQGIDKVEIYTFDINGSNSINIDLSNSIHDVMTQIESKNIPYPHFIFASPPCQAFTPMLKIPVKNRKNPQGNETYSITYNNEKNYCVRDLFEIEQLISESKFTSKYNKNKLYLTACSGLRIMYNVCYLIKQYKPICWYIENPTGSLMFDIINGGYVNNTYYSDYDNENFSRKPTTFLSNIRLHLKCLGKTKSTLHRPKGCRMPQPGGDGGKRSKIPPQLIKDIFIACFNDLQEPQIKCELNNQKFANVKLTPITIFNENGDTNDNNSK